MPTTTYDRSRTTQDFDMIDLASAMQVEIVISKDHRIWINLNGKCLLRVSVPMDITILDSREVPCPQSPK